METELKLSLNEADAQALRQSPGGALLLHPSTPAKHSAAWRCGASRTEGLYTLRVAQSLSGGFGHAASGLGEVGFGAGIEDGA